LTRKVLEVSDLSVAVEGKLVARDVSMEIEEGEITVLLGPNGSGKTSLLRAIMGLPSYKVLGGKIYLDSKEITHLPPWERSKLGLALAHQIPPPLPIKMRVLLEKLSEIHGSRDFFGDAVNTTLISYLLERNAFDGFSGGESKRAELATVALSKPKVALLDEPDSGVDIDSIRRIAKLINQMAEKGVGILLVTHAGAMARYLKGLGKGYLMINGRLSPGEDARKMLKSVLNRGYGYLGIE